MQLRFKRFIFLICMIILGSKLPSHQVCASDLQDHERRQKLQRNIYSNPEYGEQWVDYLNSMINFFETNNQNNPSSQPFIATEATYTLLLIGYIEPETFNDKAAQIMRQIYVARETVFKQLDQVRQLIKNKPDYYKEKAESAENIRSKLFKQLNPSNDIIIYYSILLQSVLRDMANLMYYFQNTEEKVSNIYWEIATVSFFEMLHFIKSNQTQTFTIDHEICKRVRDDPLPLTSILDKMLKPKQPLTEEELADWLQKVKTNGVTLAEQREKTQQFLDTADARLKGRFVHLAGPLKILYQPHPELNRVDEYPFTGTYTFLAGMIEALSPHSDNNVFLKSEYEELQTIYPNIDEVIEDLEIFKFPEFCTAYDQSIKSIRKEIADYKNLDNTKENAAAIEEALKDHYQDLYFLTLLHNVLWFTHVSSNDHPQFGLYLYKIGCVAVKELMPYVSKETTLEHTILTTSFKKILRDTLLYNPTPEIISSE